MLPAAGKNSMATDQAACALVSHVRFLDGEAAFYDMSDVKPAEIDPDITAQWPNFRGSDNNMAIVDAETPKDAEHTALQWAKKLGSGWGAAPSVQIIADDSLIVMSGTTLYKLDLEDGEVTAQAEMSAKPDWGYTPPTYGQGLIFCPLAGGTVEAFNAKTLDKVWTYQSAEGKANNWQANSPITYADGSIYVGFWKSEVAEADFVCLNAETGAEEWRYSSPGGFYWAGSAAIGDYIAVGTDDGAGDSSGNSNLLVFSKLYAGGGTAEPVSTMELTGCGDQRSSLAMRMTVGFTLPPRAAICAAPPSTRRPGRSAISKGPLWLSGYQHAGGIRGLCLLRHRPDGRRLFCHRG